MASSVSIRWNARLTKRLSLRAAALRRLRAAERRLERARAANIHPRQHLVDAVAEAERWYDVRKAQVDAARRVLKRAKGNADDALWGGSRGVTNRIVDIVGDAAEMTSRKRAASHPLSQANPGSDHNERNQDADAVDFAIANAHWLKNKVITELTDGKVKSLADYGTVVIKHEGRKFRVQAIAGTHGTGPHLHFGVERIR